MGSWYTRKIRSTKPYIISATQANPLSQTAWEGGVYKLIMIFPEGAEIENLREPI